MIATLSLVHDATSSEQRHAGGDDDRPKFSVMLPVLINEPWQVPMTICAIDTLRLCTDLAFELVIVETGDRTVEIEKRATTYIHRPFRTNPTTDCNVGLEACRGEFVVYTGNDVFVRPGWLECLWECFQIGDCGAATLASADLKHSPANIIMEGVYGPFMMFPKHYRFDAVTFPCQFADTDLIMRIYCEGMRMYRNWKTVIHHLNRQTLSGQDNVEDFKRAHARFSEKFLGCPLLMYKILTEGHVI